MKQTAYGLKLSAKEFLNEILSSTGISKEAHFQKYLLSELVIAYSDDELLYGSKSKKDLLKIKGLLYNLESCEFDCKYLSDFLKDYPIDKVLKTLASKEDEYIFSVNAFISKQLREIASKNKSLIEYNEENLINKINDVLDNSSYNTLTLFCTDSIRMKIQISGVNVKRFEGFNIEINDKSRYVDALLIDENHFYIPISFSDTFIDLPTAISSGQHVFWQNRSLKVINIPFNYCDEKSTEIALFIKE